MVKGGYFTLNKKIKEAKHIYKLHQEYKAILKVFNLPYCFIPKESLLQTLSFLKALKHLYNASDSKTTQTFFLHFFNQIPFYTQRPFLLKYKEEILEWLESKEFKEQYIKTNHPYPPLLNPKRLYKKESIEVKSQREDKEGKEELKSKEIKSNNEVKSKEIKEDRNRETKESKEVEIQSKETQSNSKETKEKETQNIKGIIKEISKQQEIQNQKENREELVEVKTEINKGIGDRDSENVESKNEESLQPYANLSYESIPASLAWDLNLPLPKCDMVKFESHGCGSIFDCFLNKIGIKSISGGDTHSGKSVYIAFFNGINNGARAIILRNYVSVRNKDGKKLHALIQKPNILCLNQVRDPISSLRCHMSIRRAGNAPRVFNLSFDVKSLVSQLVCYNSAKGVDNTIPNTSNIYFWINFTYMCFHDSVLFEEMTNLKEVEFMDMSEIVGERTLQTLQRFADIFHTEVKEEDREFFLTRGHDFGGLLPLSLYLHNCDVEKVNINDVKSLSQSGGIYLYILKKFSKGDKEDVTEELLGESFKDFIVCLCLNKEDSIKLRKNQALFQRTKTYAKELVTHKMIF